MGGLQVLLNVDLYLSWLFLQFLEFLLRSFDLSDGDPGFEIFRIAHFLSFLLHDIFMSLIMKIDACRI